MMIGVLTALPAFARDFSYTFEGQTLTYTVLDEDAKTCKTKEGTYLSYWNQMPGNDVKGDLIIPSIAKDGDIEYTVTTIGFNSFYKCENLTSVRIPDSTILIESSAFSNCSGITSLTIGKYVTNIGDDSFYHCIGLSEVKIPDSVTTIGSCAFYGCTELITLTIPENIQSIGETAFINCDNIKELYYNAENCETCGKYNAFPSSIQTLIIGENVKKSHLLLSLIVIK